MCSVGSPLPQTIALEVSASPHTRKYSCQQENVLSPPLHVLQLHMFDVYKRFLGQTNEILVAHLEPNNAPVSSLI